MDPNATLAAIRALVQDGEIGDRYAVEAIDQARELAELIENLDLWLSKGGFLPSAWGAR